MKKTVQFSKFFLPAAILSCFLVAGGITGFITKGFTLGVDFQSGLIQEVQFAPAAFTLKWHGISSAGLFFNSNEISIVVTGSGIENQTFPFSFNRYATLGSLTGAMREQLEDLEVVLAPSAQDNLPIYGIDGKLLLVFGLHGDARLNDETPFVIHYHNPAAAPIDISEVRAALADTSGVSVQNIGNIQDRKFMIRAEDRDQVRQIQALEAFFGQGEAAVLQTQSVDKRFSALTVSSSLKLLFITLLVILVYASIRFKPKFAVGAVLAIIHDGIVIAAFVVWTQMEFTTSIIAAILTILGYSINNTIVVFDRVRENRQLYPDIAFADLLNISLTNVLGRTIITTLTTILAVLFLFIFVKGAMKDFALALIVGMLSGVYTTLFIATGFVYFAEKNPRVKK